MTYIPLIELVTLIAIAMQVPVLVLVIIFSRHAYTALRISRFRLIFWGWVVNFLYLLLVALKYWLVISIDNSQIIIPSIFVGVQRGLLFKIIVFFLDFLYIFLFFLAVLNISKFDFLKWLRSKVLLSILFSFIFIYGVIRIIYIHNDNIEGLYIILSNLPFSIFSIFTLFLIAFYFWEIDKQLMRHIPYLSLGIFTYTVIQFLTIFENVEISQVYLISYSIALISKFFIAYGLHRLFIYHAEKYKVEEMFATKLNQIIGMTFHELIRPFINMESYISKLLIKGDKDIHYSSKVKKILQLIEMQHSKAYANLIAQKRLFMLYGRKGKKLEAQNARYEDKLQSVSVNSLLEISLLTLKNVLGENIEFITEYSSGSNLYCNPNELLQVFDNILRNSYDAFPEGRGVIYIRTMIESSHTEKEGLKKQVRVEILDNGEGIGEKIKDKIFYDSFSTRQGIGRGYGLAIVKDLVLKNYGEICIKSPTNSNKFKTNLGGTKVILKFPKIN